MYKKALIASVLLAWTTATFAAASAPQAGSATTPSQAAVDAAKYAVATYRNDVVDTLARLVSFNTVVDARYPSDRNPVHIAFKAALKEEAERLGLDVADHGWTVIVGLGKGSERVGIVTHGDVQPVDPTKWKKSPFVLDRTSEPGKLIARGAEDDKGPIATALYAMKTIRDRQIPLNKRIELYVYMGEESDWGPLTEFLKTHVPPQLSITLDAEYPVVTAEKGGGTVAVTVPKAGAKVPAAGEAYIAEFKGGSFNTQIPEDAEALVANATPDIERQMRARGAAHEGMHYTFERQGANLKVVAKGLSAHSSKPQEGVNAVSMLADALAVRNWPNTVAGGVVNYLNDLVGTGYYGEKFGKIAYRDSFMGPLTFKPTVIRQLDDGIEIAINLRRPRGKTSEQLSGEIDAALADWQARQLPLANIKVGMRDPWILDNPPQLNTLLSTFSYFTGMKDAKAVAIGGGTNSRLFPNAVSFGPSMPGAKYTGHSEHEFITTRQLLLNLQMYTAVLVDLAK
ncbi:dipeptidase [Massilia sp. HP4]|uniref:dipeptidase n=1 Tax=Massilia sp. HP4 TaxID=2562316 RepID=UPI0010BFDFA7|nr:dipeptidase [Massilia sp. HP4]